MNSLHWACAVARVQPFSRAKTKTAMLQPGTSIGRYVGKRLLADGCIHQALRQMGYQTEPTWCQPYHFKPKRGDNRSHQVILKEVRVQNDPGRKLSLAKGFVVLAWGDAGWVRFFSKAPAFRPEDFKGMKFFAWGSEPDQQAITRSIHDMIREVQKYVPGYKLVNGPVFDGKRVSVFLEVEGLGDYLPKYAGNLDIMTAAAARTAEMFAEEILAGTLKLQ